VKNVITVGVVVAFALSGCKDIEMCHGNQDCINAVLQGWVRDYTGYQPQSEFGGSGTAAATAKVQVAVPQADGTVQVIATGTVAAGGRFSVSTTPGQKYIVQAIDAQGGVRAAGIVAATTTGAGTTTMAPLDGESSVEAHVLLHMLAAGVPLADVDVIDLRARVNANVAAAVQASTGDASAALRGLGESIAAAQRTEVHAFVDLGVHVTADQMFQAKLAAAAKLDVALDGGAQADAYASFFADVDAALAGLGIDAKTEARGESCASAAMRATINARLSVSPTVAASARLAAASLEARTSAAATQAILHAGAAAQAVSDSATAAGTKLRADLTAAADFTAATAAYTAFATSIDGGADVSTSVLGQYLAVDVTTKTTAQGAVDVATNASATLDTTLNTVVAAGGSVDFDAVASAVVTAYDTFASTVGAQTTALATFGAKAQPTVDVLIVAQGAFRLRSASAPPPPGDMGSGPPATAAVAVTDTGFAPATAIVAAGGTVTWTWSGTANSHTVTSGTGGTPDGKFCNDVAAPTAVTCMGTLAAKKTGTYAFTFATAGSYPYYCAVHPGETGTITVQ
jgi:plastocyanin